MKNLFLLVDLGVVVRGQFFRSGLDSRRITDLVMCLPPEKVEYLDALVICKHAIES